MVAGLSFFTSEWPNKNSRTKRRCNRAIFPNGLCVGKKSIADAIDIRRCSPCMNAFSAPNLMRRRAVPAVRAYEHRRVNFAPEILQESGQQEDCARHVMRELA